MKSNVLSRTLVVAAIVSAFSIGLFAEAVVAQRKPPVLRTDPSPVSDGKALVVTSYADIVEPVQKAVVSVYSKKIVRERVAMNPLLHSTTKIAGAARVKARSSVTF